MEHAHDILAGIMARIFRTRVLLLAIVLIVAGGLVASALEAEGPNHQLEMHHCAVCCATHHVAATIEPMRFAPSLVPSEYAVTAVDALYTEPVIRLPDIPPERSA